MVVAGATRPWHWLENSASLFWGVILFLDEAFVTISLVTNELVTYDSERQVDRQLNVKEL